MSRLDDVEPVAYRSRHNEEEVWKLTNNKIYFDGDTIEPLYTREQLMPKVKMTQKQYERFEYDKKNNDLDICLTYFIEHDGKTDFGLPRENLMGDLTQEDIAIAWINPEETIEIIKDKKWFVVSKERDEDGDYVFVSDINKINDFGYSSDKNSVNNPRVMAHAFDTEEEANQWVTPKMHVVELEVE